MLLTCSIHTVSAQEPGANNTVDPSEPIKSLHIVSDNNFPPYLFRDPDGEVRGYTADVWKLFEKETGIKVTLTAMNWAEAQKKILAGEADAIDLIYRTPAREVLYDFSLPYMHSSSAIFSHESIAGISGIETLHGFRIGVQAGDACIDHLKLKGITDIITYRNYTEMIHAANQNNIKIFCMDEFPANYYLYKENVQDRFSKSFILFKGYFHRATRKGDTDTLRTIEAGMSTLKSDDLDRLKEKWLGSKVSFVPYLSYLTWGTAFLGLLGLLLGTWNLALRRAVTTKTAAMKVALTELRIANQASEYANEQLLATLNAIPDLLFKLDANGTYLEVFAREPDELAAPADDLIGRSVHDVLPAEVANTILESIKAAALTRADHGRLIYLPLNGVDKWFEFSTTANLHKSTGDSYFLVLSRDVTLRRQTELEVNRLKEEALLAEKNKQFQLLFDSAPVAMGYLVGDSIEAVNRHFIDLLGYDRNDIMTIEDWWPRAFPDPAVRADAQTRWSAALERARDNAGVVDNLEYLITTKGGIQLSMLVGGQLMENGIVATFVDISQLKQIENDLNEARLAAQSANSAKSSFLANMSHEIRTPLNAIIGTGHQMRRVGLPADQSARLDKLNAAATHLLRLISDILDLSKIESGKFQLEEVSFNLDTVLTNVRSFVSDKIDSNQVSLIIDSDSLPGCFIGDETRLQQCLLNYLSNAIKFTRKGQITVRVESLEHDATFAMLRFEVQDTGIGVSPDAVARLFGTFEQAATDTTRLYGGTGLGLSITKQLVELMGGTVGVSSTPGVGSTFWFTAKLGVCSDSMCLQPAREVEDAEQVIKREYRDSRVLVVEDEPINQGILQFLLEDAGLVVDLADHGEDAVAMAQLTAYTAILMDMQMPVMDGIAATKHIREIGIHRHTPIIAMTANAFSEDRNVCMEAGMDDFLTKPVIPDRLFSALLNAFQLT